MTAKIKTASPGQGFEAAHKTHHTANRSAPTPKAQGFRRDLLPAPAEYFAAQGLKMTGGGAWRDAICPFHQDTKPSLRVRLETGAFRCMACGAHGGDVLDYHRLITGLPFKRAAQDLGAWEAGQ